MCVWVCVCVCVWVWVCVCVGVKEGREYVLKVLISDLEHKILFSKK